MLSSALRTSRPPQRNHSGDHPLRRPHRATAPINKGPRANRDIQVPEVQLIDENGDNRGVVPTQEALRMAQDAGLDLVEISPSNKPPIAKILDHGRHKFLAQKKKAEAKRKQKVIEVKEIKMRPNIDTHDYDVKMRKMVSFFEDGDKVKVTMRFRGREMAHTELGMDLLMKVKEDTEKIAKVEAEPKMEGRQMMMVLSPR